MRVVQAPHRSQWGNPGAPVNGGYGGTLQRPPASGEGRLPVASPVARGSAMSPTRMRMGGLHNKYVTPTGSHMRPPQMASPQRRVESRQVPISPPQVPKQQNDVIDLTDIDERDIDNLLPKRAPPTHATPVLSAPKTAGPLISPPKGYKFQMPPPVTARPQKPHVPKVMPEQGRKPRVMSHHSEMQRLPVASSSKLAPESPRSPMLPVSTANPGSTQDSPTTQTSGPSTAHQRLANGHASRAGKQTRSIPQEQKKQTNQAVPSKHHTMSIADRLRAVNESRPGIGQQPSDARETISGPLPQLPTQPKKEVQPSFDSAHHSAYSAYSAYTSCTEYSNYTEPSMDSDISPFDPAKDSKKRGVINELIRHTTGRLVSESADEFDGKACFVATKELTQMLADDVKELSGFGHRTGEQSHSDASSTATPEEKTETKNKSKEELTLVAKKETNPTNVCLAETQDCMMSFQEDVTFVAGLGISKLQEACLPEVKEDMSCSIQGDDESSKDKAVKESDESGCVNETADCMRSFREDVAYVATLGASKINGDTSTAGGVSSKNSAAKDDDSGVFAATADCFVQLKDDIKYGMNTMRGIKLSELEVRGLIVSIAQGLDEPLYLQEADSGSVLTEDFRSSTGSVNEDLDSLDDSHEARSTADSARSIDAMSADPLPGESVLDSIKKQLELQSLQSFGDPVIEEIKRADPPGEDKEKPDYAATTQKSSHGRADPPALENPYEEQPSIAPGDANDGQESTEETEELITVEETIDEETVEEEVEEEIIEDASDSPDDEVTAEDEEEFTLPTVMETDEDTSTDAATDVAMTTEEEVLKTPDKNDVHFPDLLPNEI